MESITYLTSAFNRWWETAKEDLHGYQHASYHYRSRSAARRRRLVRSNQCNRPCAKPHAAHLFRRRLIRQASAFLQQVLLTLVASKQGLFGSPNCYGSFLLLLARASCQNFHRIRQDAASIKQNAPTKKKIVSPSRLSNIRLFRS
jgi:hypothetical protein